MPVARLRKVDLKTSKPRKGKQWPSTARGVARHS
jgi:hypothetical protein